jgi:hypothetical protein
MSYCRECEGTGRIERRSFMQTPDSATWETWTEPCTYCADEDDYDWRGEDQE